jgi:mRNA-degrading endonuclease RelE of RelBE toxin-antitoxin system
LDTVVHHKHLATAGKFVFYRLLLSVDDKQPAVTVTDIEFRVRQTGYAK